LEYADLDGQAQVTRTYYYVGPIGTRWAMKVDGNERVWEFATEAEALKVATTAARALWENGRVLSGVRIQATDGTWRLERRYGDTPFPPPRWPKKEASTDSSDAEKDDPIEKE
jgi:hypothetical protein